MTKRKRGPPAISTATSVATPNAKDEQMMMNLTESDEARILEEINSAITASINEATEYEAGRTLLRQLNPMNFYINKETQLPIRVVFTDFIELNPGESSAGYTMLDDHFLLVIYVLSYSRGVAAISDAEFAATISEATNPNVRFKLSLHSLDFNSISPVSEWTPEQIAECTQFLEYPDVFLRRTGILPVIDELQSRRL